MSLPPLKFGLDWLTNTAHASIFAAVAEIQRLTGRDVAFVCPGDDSAPSTPADGLLVGTLDFGLIPCDQLVSIEHSTPGVLQAVLNLHSNDISALCVLSTSSVQRPSDLLGLRYASCGYPLEADTIRAIIRKDMNQSGGARETADKDLLVEECPLLRTNTEDMLLAGEADCVWMYRPWEVLRAKQAGIELRCFSIQDHASFGPMNMVCVRKDAIQPQLIRQVVAAIQDGARITRDSPMTAVQCLMPRIRPPVEEELLLEGVGMLKELGALDAKESLQYGMFDQAVWDRFADYLGHDLGRKDLANVLVDSEGKMWTNEYFKSPS